MPSSTGAPGSAAAEQRLTGLNQDPNTSNDADLRALSPTPRKSERERPPVCYEKMNNGRRSDTDDENGANAPDPNQHGLIQGQQNNQKNKKPMDPSQNAAKKQGVEDANKRIRDFFNKLGQHEAAAMMNEPIAKNSQFEQYRSEWKALVMIDSMHRCGKYSNSKEIMQDIDSMILTKFRMLHTSGESEDLMKAHAFQKYFDQISQGLGNLSLSNKQEKPKPPEKKPKPEP